MNLLLKPKQKKLHKMENKIFYTISEFAKKLGIHPQTIRSYQRKGLLPEKRHPLNGYRIFTEEDVTIFRNLILKEKKLIIKDEN